MFESIKLNYMLHLYIIKQCTKVSCLFPGALCSRALDLLPTRLPPPPLFPQDDDTSSPPATTSAVTTDTSAESPSPTSVDGGGKEGQEIETPDKLTVSVKETEVASILANLHDLVAKDQQGFVLFSSVIILALLIVTCATCVVCCRYCCRQRPSRPPANPQPPQPGGDLEMGVLQDATVSTSKPSPPLPPPPSPPPTTAPAAAAAAAPPAVDDMFSFSASSRLPPINLPTYSQPWLPATTTVANAVGLPPVPAFHAIPPLSSFTPNTLHYRSGDSNLTNERLLVNESDSSAETEFCGVGAKLKKR